MDYENYLRFLASLLVVLALIGAVAWTARRFGLAPRVTPPGRRDRRLQVVEVTAIDARRRLVLVRRDDREHLVLLGQGGDLVIERGIRRPVETAVEEPA